MVVRMRYGCWRVAGLLVALIVLGCGERGSAPPGSAEGPSRSDASEAAKACTLLAPEEIRDILGAPPGEPRPGDSPAACRWPGSEDSEAPLVEILVTPARYRSFQHFVDRYTQEVGEEPGSGYRPVSGIGDWALYVEDERALRVTAGGETLEIRLGPGHGADEAVELASRALARLR